MACQEDACWRCAEAWGQERQTPKARLRLVAAPQQPLSTAERLTRLREEAHA